MPRKSNLAPVFAQAQKHLADCDPIIKILIGQIGACTLLPDSDSFGVLSRSIISQQISTRAARAIAERLHLALAPEGIVPHKVQSVAEKTLRGAGLSAAKVRALRDLAEKTLNGHVPLSRLSRWPDEKIIAQLTEVRGIGRWTAEMFLIFGLGRLDILPVSDYGLRAGVQKHFLLPELPGREELMELAEPWRPYRTVATWFIWRSLGNVPQSAD